MGIFAGKIRALVEAREGTAASEFAAVSMFLVIGLLNAVDIGFYLVKRLEVENAARAGAQAAWKTCYDKTSMLPAVQNCPGLTDALTASIQSTSLGGAVSLTQGYPIEGYYCADASNSLQLVGSPGNKPSTCADAGNANVAPGDYVQVGVSYNYQPLFAFSVMSARGGRPIQMVSWMRLG